MRRERFSFAGYVYLESRKEKGCFCMILWCVWFVGCGLVVIGILRSALHFGVDLPWVFQFGGEF